MPGTVKFTQVSVPCRSTLILDVVTNSAYQMALHVRRPRRTGW